MIISPEIEDACRSSMHIGETVRIRHKQDAKGNLCTPPEKDEACAITRTEKGWVWYCHRCYENGFKSAEYCSPTDLKAMMKAKAQAKVKAVAKITLPSDARPMGEEAVPEEGIPIAAYTWLWKYGITAEDMQDYEMYWSDLYQRVILPVRNLNSTLIGWVGREVKHLTKEAREKAGTVKYLLRRDTSEDRIYYRLKGSMDKTIVIVEDIISAIKVHKAMDCHSLALLTTSMDTKLIRTLRGFKVNVWLDADALAKCMQIVSRLSQLGIATSYTHTVKDPKAYEADEIRKYIGWGVKT